MRYAVVATVKDANYEGSASGQLVMDKAPLTVTATVSPDWKYLGAPDPKFGVNYSGFLNGEIESVLSGTLIYTTDVPNPEKVGTHLQVGWFKQFGFLRRS